ncbi:unnamed protein product [Rhizophagus irregularis]|nr:unnamed protein product [Rhizophagus irregularis]
MMCRVKFIERNWLQSRHFKKLAPKLENDSKEIDSNSDMTESGPGWPVIEIKRKNDLTQCSLVHWAWDFASEATRNDLHMRSLYFFKTI